MNGITGTLLNLSGVPKNNYRLEESIIINERCNYFDIINEDNKNQTAKVLEKYFYSVNGICDYVSVVQDEIEEYKNLPTMEEVKVQADRAVKYASHFVVNACNFGNEFDADVFKSNLCGMNFLIDKLLAINFADIFNQKDVYKSEREFGEALVLSVVECRKNWDNEPISDEYKPVVHDGFEVDTSKLYIGMTVKNYKVLCELLGQPVKAGKSRICQLEEFKRYFDWEKSGQKFIVTDIYDTPLTKEDKRKLGNNSIYVQCIEVILLQFLSKQEGFTRTFTKKMWWEMLGITNHKYGRVSETQLRNLDYTVTQFEIRHFYQRCNKKLEQILFSALNSLKNRKLITYEIQMVIVEHDERGKERYFLASDNDKKNILQAERHILHNVMGYDKMFQVFIKSQQGEFYQKVSNLIYEKYGWNYYFKQVKVIYTPEDIREALPQMEINLQKELLNKKVIDFLNNNAQEFYNKKVEEYEEKTKNLLKEYIGEPEPESMKKSNSMWKIPDTYLTAQSILTDELIKIGHKDMTFSVEDFIKSNAELDDLFSFDK